MNEIDFSKLRVVVADDFSNFRATINAMLGKFGIKEIELAANARELLDLCKTKKFDVILCDYDLGPGKNGQQALEELRHDKIITKKCIFIVVSADAAKDVVMAAYDCEPDDYLMKPITAKMLKQRMSRLLIQRRILAPVYDALAKNQKDSAIMALIDLTIGEGRHVVPAQKLLGELFIEEGELAKAEKLYTKALETRQVDWARLGLAKVKQLRGELDTAGEWIEQIIEENPLFLPAYDVLATNWEKMGEHFELQRAVERSIEISPKSILRQKRLAKIAEENGDLITALNALRATVKLGELSCHASAEDNLNFARVASNNIEKELQPAVPLSFETLEVISMARDRFTLDKSQLDRADLLQARAHVHAGDRDKGRQMIENVNEASSYSNALNVDLERVSALQTIDEHERADDLVKQLVDRYQGDEESLQLIERLINDPVSESSRNMVAEVNRGGIELYNQARYDDAIACFEKAQKVFPKHVGIQLNIVQSLVGKMRSGLKDERTIEHTRKVLSMIDSMIEPGHSQYERFIRLQDMASSSMSNT